MLKTDKPYRCRIKLFEIFNISLFLLKFFRRKHTATKQFEKATRCRLNVSCSIVSFCKRLMKKILMKFRQSRQLKFPSSTSWYLTELCCSLGTSIQYWVFEHWCIHLISMILTTPYIYIESNILPNDKLGF